MERKAHNSLNEAVLQVAHRLDESKTPKSSGYYAMTKAMRDAHKKGLIKRPGDHHGFGQLGQDVRDELLDKAMLANKKESVGLARHLLDLKESLKTVKTKSGSTERVSQSDLEAAGSLYDRLMSSKLDKKKFGTAGVYKVDTIHGKPVKKESVELALEYFENYFGDELKEALSGGEKLERSKYRLGAAQAGSTNDERIRKRRKVVQGRKEKEIRKTKKDYFNSKRTSDDNQKMLRKLDKIRDMASLRKGWQKNK